MDLDPRYPVKSKNPYRQIHHSETEETLPGGEHVDIPGTLALELRHEGVPTLCSELNGVRIYASGWHTQRQVRLKIRDKPHVNEGLSQGKEKIPTVVAIGV